MQLRCVESCEAPGRVQMCTEVRWGIPRNHNIFRVFKALKWTFLECCDHLSQFTNNLYFLLTLMDKNLYFGDPNYAHQKLIKQCPNCSKIVTERLLCLYVWPIMDNFICWKCNKLRLNYNICEKLGFLLVGPLKIEGPMKWLLSFRLPVSLQFSLVTAHYFLLIFYIMVDNYKIKKLTEPNISRTFLFSEKWEKWAQNGQKQGFYKGGLVPSKKICFNKSPLKMMKNVFYLILKALFVLKIFKFLSWLFDHVDQTSW